MKRAREEAKAPSRKGSLRGLWRGGKYNRGSKYRSKTKPALAEAAIFFLSLPSTLNGLNGLNGLNADNKRWRRRASERGRRRRRLNDFEIAVAAIAAGERVDQSHRRDATRRVGVLTFPFPHQCSAYRSRAALRNNGGLREAQSLAEATRG